ncbi:hypothetical protein [uncultured Streptococcus sp.]|uniref:hypothetical protein n=1 Tax=uncultured Streptococcus sp. TaxID=83427 RepID=UPI0027DC3CDC|nr:hypothetical protein [uncultured Streptococcus sp.]
MTSDEDKNSNLETSAPITESNPVATETPSPAIPNEQCVRATVEFAKASMLDYASQQQKTVAQLSQAEIEKKLREIKEEQDKILDEISKTVAIDKEKVKRYNAIVNGAAFDVLASEIEKIKSIAGVEKVYFSREYVQAKPLLSSSDHLIGLSQLCVIWSQSSILF